MEGGVAKKKILLVDDVELFLELEKTFFRREDFHLLIARTGKEALAIAKAEKPDLVFMDLHMPELAGDECCRMMKADAELSDIPVVMVTTRGSEADIERCRRFGCEDVLPKPINRHHFVATARRLLGIADRSLPRVRTTLRVRYGTTGQHLLSDYAVNVCTGGLFLATDQPLAVDTSLALKFELSEKVERDVHCRGRVAWVKANGAAHRPGLPCGFGVQFTEIAPEDMEAIQEFVKQESITPHW